MITYRSDARPGAAAIAELYRAAPLNRPVDDVQRIRRMYEGSNIILTAWDNEKLVGILRGWTDGAYDGYVCDLAVAPDYQKAGIGKALLEKACTLGPEIQFVLRASKIAAAYYVHLGWEKVENGWVLARQQ
jgi:ribosomal protein S18 acetylase RimI-like enzyme